METQGAGPDEDQADRRTTPAQFWSRFRGQQPRQREQPAIVGVGASRARATCSTRPRRWHRR